ncbi:MAG TPA: biosynthetic arginine decarboxylase [Planctomycetes bacterium]|nr:biosynthetic arginine decarboxylase [Planctomycetota bacterium]HIL37798.1 biosynthetic arginine decarboxylase [Planctomycetota bacterium]
MNTSPQPWNAARSEELYNISAWGQPFFGVSPLGNLTVTPEGPEGGSIDLPKLVEQIRQRGVSAPLLLRFDGLLRARVRQINTAFNHARREYDFNAPYRGVFPIKVNQERHVVEALLKEGRSYGMGLEVGSKPELIAGISIQAGEGTLMICNGYKDQEYVEMALLASHLGITAVLVVEKLTELDTILAASERLGIQPVIGVRSKLALRGSGRWQDSSGDRSKFGLTAREIVAVTETLGARGMLSCLRLCHFHIGSQITQIRSLKQALREATHIFVGLSELGCRIDWFDVGGGLGVNYEGDAVDSDSTMNYSLQEYANDVVWSLGEACRKHNITQPTVVSESGRAIAAHHAVLVAEVVGVSSFEDGHDPQPLTLDAPDVVREMAALASGLTEGNAQEHYHDALDLREKAGLLFETGLLNLVQRGQVEEHFWRAANGVLRVVRQMDVVPEDMQGLELTLSDTYFVNMSIFQSLPDAWAIDQVFPVMPIQRLNEEPTRRATLADLTCDSDGRIGRFLDQQGTKDVLEVHALKDSEPYHMGFFLTGAYQEILGDMHNLFGDTNVVHVDLDERGRPRLSNILRGDRVKEVLSYVEYFEEDLLRSLRGHVEDALEAGRMTFEESGAFWERYEAGLRGYTYLTHQDTPAPDPKASLAQPKQQP